MPSFPISDRHERWTQADDAWLFGYFRYLWADATLKIATVSVGYDTDKDSTLDSDEILTAITTKIVERN